MKTSLLASLLVGLVGLVACGTNGDPESNGADGGQCPAIEAGACVSASGQCATLTCTDGAWVCPPGYMEVGGCGTEVDSGSDAGASSIDAGSDSGSCTNVAECPNIPPGSEDTCHYGPPACVDGINECGTLICTDAGAVDAGSDGG